MNTSTIHRSFGRVPAPRPADRCLSSPRDRRQILVSEARWPSGSESTPKPNLSGILVRPAVTPAEVQAVFDVRWQGYKKYFEGPEDVIDVYDSAPNVTLLLATDVEDRPLGTMRILDRSSGAIELDGFLDVESVLTPPERPCVEATRFAVPAHPRSHDTKLALWKSFHEYSSGREVRTMVIWARRAAARMYRRLLFEDVGPIGAFRHPRLGNLPHRTYKVFLPAVEFLYRSQRHPLSDFFFGR